MRSNRNMGSLLLITGITLLLFNNRIPSTDMVSQPGSPIPADTIVAGTYMSTTMKDFTEFTGDNSVALYGTYPDSEGNNNADGTCFKISTQNPVNLILVELHVAGPPGGPTRVEIFNSKTTVLSYTSFCRPSGPAIAVSNTLDSTVFAGTVLDQAHNTAKYNFTGSNAIMLQPNVEYALAIEAFGVPFSGVEIVSRPDGPYWFVTHNGIPQSQDPETEGWALEGYAIAGGADLWYKVWGR